MGAKIIIILAFLVLIQEINVEATGNQLTPTERTKSSQLNPIENYTFDPERNENNSKGYSENLSRVKRQYPYGGRDRYYPLPIIVGGGWYPAIGPRGYGGRGYGGRGGFGGRGFGGRGIGGRGIGGRGIGGRGIGGRGIGGRGGIGGGRGGRG